MLMDISMFFFLVRNLLKIAQNDTAFESIMYMNCISRGYVSK